MADIELGVLGPGSADLTVVGVRSGATRVPLAFPGDQYLASVNYLNVDGFRDFAENEATIFNTKVDNDHR